MAVFYAFKRALIDIYKNASFPLEGANFESDSVAEKGPHTQLDKLRGGPHGGPYKPRDQSNHTGWSEHKNS